MNETEIEFIKTKCRRIMGLSNYPQKYGLLCIELDELKNYLKKSFEGKDK